MATPNNHGDDGQKNGRTPKSTASTDTNSIKFGDTMERKMAEELLSGWQTMPGLVGGRICGGNPYQYVKALRSKDIDINYMRECREQYGRYKITHPESRARVKKALTSKSSEGDC